MQTKMECPRCHTEIPLDDVNVATDMALCRRCNQTWSFADLQLDGRVQTINAQTPPKGTWLREDHSGTFTVGATTRSWGALFLVPFTCVWAGGSLTGIYGTQIYSGHFNLFFSLFGLPFLIGSICLIGMTLMTIGGRVTVTVNGGEGVIFTGVGAVGWRRRFSWREVKAIRCTERRNGRNYSTVKQITFEGAKRMNFASGLKEARLDFMYAVLCKKWRESGGRA